MKEVEELEMLTQKLMKDMDHPPHSEATTSGTYIYKGGGGVRCWEAILGISSS